MPFRCLASFVSFLNFLAREKCPVMPSDEEGLISLFLCLLLLMMCTYSGLSSRKNLFTYLLLILKEVFTLGKLCLKRIKLKDNPHVKHFTVPTLART